MREYFCTTIQVAKLATRTVISSNTSITRIRSGDVGKIISKYRVFILFCFILFIYFFKYLFVYLIKILKCISSRVIMKVELLKISVDLV